MKKNGKMKVVILIGIISLLMTWFIAGGVYSDTGAYTVGDITRAGVFDFFSLLFYSFYYHLPNIMYLLTLGGCYGVLAQTKAYRKLVDKTVNLVKGKEIVACLVVTLLMGLYTSITNEIFSLLIFVPFIVSVVLKCEKDRVTALAIAFGGIFIGTIGQTFGTYGLGDLISTLELSFTDGIGYKITLFVIAYVLYNLFTIMHMVKQYKEVDETEYDMYLTEKLDEKKVKKYNRTKIWPTAIFMGLVIIITLLAFINWQTSFDISAFTDANTNLQNLKVGDIPVFASLIGTMTAFGEWDLINLTAVLIIITLIIGLINGSKVYKIMDDFGSGMKKMSKVAVIYGLVFVVFMVCYAYAWPVTVTVKLMGSKFNLFRLFIGGLFMAFFCVDGQFISYSLGTYVATNYAANLVSASLIMNTAFSLVQVLAPTSFILMIALTYLDVPYKDWLKYIWKYALSICAVSLLLFAIMVFM